MKTQLLLCLTTLLAGFLLACSNFVNDVDAPLDINDDESLNDESRVELLITGVQHRFATTYARTVLLADALSDGLVFEQSLPAATSQSFKQIDAGKIRLDNSDITQLFRALGELRFLADDLLVRADHIQFSDSTLSQRVLFTGNFYGGIARYFYATYTGISENEGGGVINNGPFIPAGMLYNQAIEKFVTASENTTDEYEQRLTNSIIARTYLYNGESARAALFAGDGLQINDPPFQAFYSQDASNSYWSEAGRGNTQFVAHPRFRNFIKEEPLEAQRLTLEPVDVDSMYWRQNQYPAFDSEIDFISWQEIELILAETDLNDNNSAGAIGHVNGVRAFYGLSSLMQLDVQTLLVEREKTLFLQGIRLVDQRRFNLFHLPVGTWQYLPIPEEERIGNPNFN